MSTKAESEYIPGVCNINRTEIAYRRKWEIIGFSVTAILFVGLLFSPVHPILRSAIIFLPLFIGAVGYLQVKNKFCVSFAASGMQNATPGSESPSAIADAEARKADKAKANSMNLKAALFTLAVCVASALIPNIPLLLH